MRSLVLFRKDFEKQMFSLCGHVVNRNGVSASSVSFICTYLSLTFVQNILSVFFHHISAQFEQVQ